MPPIYNYKIFEYNAAGQNWGVSLNAKGVLFAANNKGLLQYNGEEWLLHKLPNSTTIRSVASINDRIYTGSYEEFGYWKKNALGHLEYTSLTHLITGHVFTNEEFWQIIPFGKAILFRSFSAIYRYEDEKITVINPGFVVTNMAIYDGKILVASKNKGLYILNQQGMLSSENNHILSNMTVTDMVPFTDALLIGTQLNGCFLLRQDQLVPWDKGTYNVLKQHQLNKILQLTTGELVFGTIKNGIYIYDPIKNTLINLNKETGLQNNTILSMNQFQDQLWVGLEKGIDRISINTSIGYYTDYSGVLGTVHDLALYKNTIYLGSNTGIYYFNNDSLKFVNGSQGHVWDLKVIDKDLLVGHNTGTFKVDGEKLEITSEIAGGYQLVKIPEMEHTLLQGTYTGIAKYEYLDDNWQVTRLKGGIDFPIKQLCFEDAQNIWAAHPYKGLFKFKLNEAYDEVINIQEINSDAIPDIYNINLFNVKNQIVIQSGGIWYKYDAILGKIGLFKELEPYNHKVLIYTDGDHFWFIDQEGTKEITYTDLRSTTISIAEAPLGQRLVPDMEKVVKLTDSIYYLTLTDGFARINLSELNKNLKNAVIPKPELDYFKDGKMRYAINDTSFLVPNKNSHDLSFQFSAASLMKPRYYFELTGASSRSNFVERGTMNFQNLPHGDYKLAISTVSLDNKKSLPKVIQFEITPPWYLTKLSMVFYFLGLLGVIFTIRLYNRKKLNRKHNKLKEQLNREQEELLARLEKEKLEKEIKHKQKELASTTMNVAKKNELILELKNLLLTNKDKFSNQQRYRSFIKKLNSSINDDEDWRNFEVNFKELHEDFFEILLQRYSNLTPKDLKLCAYLKMNLSSKEIAPLMGITIRGVEIHRYRLRKKLKLDSSRNISNFLITLK